MDLSKVLERYRDDSRTKQVVETIKEGRKKVRLTGLVGAVEAFVATGVFKNHRTHHIFILPDKEEAAYFQNDLEQLFERKTPLFFADSYQKPGHFENINRSNVLMRTEALNALFQDKKVGELIVTYPQAIFEKVTDKADFDEHTLSLKVGEEIDPDFMNDVLQDNGFERTDFVYEPGQYSVRGGIIDIFSFVEEYPYRIELFGDEIDSIRLFNPENQLSEEKVGQATLVPDMQSHFQQQLDRQSLFDLLPSDTVVWIKNGGYVKESLQECAEKVAFLADQMDADPSPEEGEAKETLPLVPGKMFIDPERWLKQVNNFPLVEFGKQFHFEPDRTVLFNMKPQPPFNKDFDLFIKNLQENRENRITNYLFASSARQIERFYEIFEDKGFEGQFYPLKTTIHEGFIDNDLKLACYTDHQIFNRYHRYKLHRGFSKTQAMAVKELKQLKPGDYVTHVDHGIGKYMGLQKIEVNDTLQEAVRIHYKDNDLLYVNINALHKISKFVSKDGKSPKLNKLGSGAWERLKRRTKKKVKDIAKDLIKLYAERRSADGFKFSPDDYLQAELEASFMYLDTPDQEKATRDVKEDMEEPHPMDRLICGDVGFGKTEVAIRAAFKAITDSKQVAMLVPTTILAFQHYKTFSERLADFPGTVDYLNRFKTRAEEKDILERLEQGKIDIIIGTHKLLSKKVKFYDLGLLVIDEEQKFGVAHKEKIRQIKTNVDTLTLTATPIPRTLQFSLMGARDLSVINTPPPNRQAIQTELHTFDQETIQKAIDYEVNRDGQVYFIHNRIKDIGKMEQMVRELCPDVKLAVAHGRMDGKTLEDIMVKFIDGKFDVLLSTAIVESGIDIPNVNTIIINNAHQFGLSDLHQLRGRVGRSNKKAFCYLFAPTYVGLTPEARRRLKTVEEYADLGSGFSIAMRDLDIRGAGNLLGAEQSGFIAEMGLETYHKVLDEAIQELKETEFKELFKEQLQKKAEYVKDCEIDTDLEIYIPDDYVTNINERLSLYTQINNAKSEKKLKRLYKELRDRFGPVPDTVEELFNTIRLRWVAKQLGFERLVLKKNRLKCFFTSNETSPFFETPLFTNILTYIQQQPDRSDLKETKRHLILTFARVETIREAIELLDEVLEAARPGEEVEGEVERG